MQTDGMNVLRRALRACGDEIVTVAKLSAMLGLSKHEQRVARNRLSRLVKTGRLKRWHMDNSATVQTMHHVVRVKVMSGCGG